MAEMMVSWWTRWWKVLLGLFFIAGLAACGAPQNTADDAPRRGSVVQDEPARTASLPPDSVLIPDSASAALHESESSKIAEAAAVTGTAANARSKMAPPKMAPPRMPRAESTLGTQWGEGRESVTKVVQASRVTPGQPRALGQLRYSDEGSIRRALGRNAEQQLSMLLANGDVELEIGAGSGRPVYGVFSARGMPDSYVAGRHGERYELIYTNRSNRYYEVVATVDGLDVLTGQAGSTGNDGYLLRPGERLVIDGFRKSDREVAAFRFSNKDRAYASNTPAGDARNAGVIGTALFEVRLDEPDPDLPRARAPASRQPQPQAFPADSGRYAPPPQYGR